MVKCINFFDLQVTPLLNGLITQTIVKWSDDTKDLSKGAILNICFEGELFSNYKLQIKNIKRTGIAQLSNQDIIKNGFLYKPHFISFYQGKGISKEDTILKIDFVLVEGVNEGNTKN